VLAGAKGVRLYLQTDPQHFTDITAKSKIPANVANAAYLGAWPFDVDLDGDLDIVLSQARAIPWCYAITATIPSPSCTRSERVQPVAFASADIDGDGDRRGHDRREGLLHVFTNERLGDFNRALCPPGSSGVFWR